MNPEFSRFREQENQDQPLQSEQKQQQSVVEFGSVEELIRHDAEETAPPPQVAERLAASILREKNIPWWKRLLGGGDP
jgi:hypothetical protein